MKILPVTRNYYQQFKMKTQEKKNASTYFSSPSAPITMANTYPTFGYCNIHIGRMKTTNVNVENAILKSFENYDKIKRSFDNYNKKLEYMKSIQNKAALLVTQYASYQYSLAEVIPSYALQSSSEIMKAIEQTKIFETPQEILLTIANIPKLETVSGIDKNTGKAYTQEQLRKSKANSQLYSTVIMLDLLDKKIASSKLKKTEADLILKMRNSVVDTISSIYGVDAYDRIQKLKMMGEDASLEDKRASLSLLQDFDSKAKDLDFGRDFYKNLDKLLKHNATIKTELEASLLDTKTSAKVTLHYHTHPEDVEHTHSHEHPHHHHHHHESSVHHEHSHEYSHEEMHKLGIEHSHAQELDLDEK